MILKLNIIRYKIILGLGSALHYLHRDWDQHVVHGDIKPRNIMLDSSYNAKLGDFRLARLGDHGTGPQTTDLVKGTMGTSIQSSSTRTVGARSQTSVATVRGVEAAGALVTHVQQAGDATICWQRCLDGRR